MAPVPTPSPCEEKARLMHTYEVAASDYMRAVSVLSQRAGVLNRSEYVRIRDYSEKARFAAEVARDTLDRHLAVHGCD